jgi:hypothetical protein
LFREQRGVVYRPQLLRLGMTDHEIHTGWRPGSGRLGVRQARLMLVSNLSTPQYPFRPPNWPKMQKHASVIEPDLGGDRPYKVSMSWVNFLSI